MRENGGVRGGVVLDLVNPSCEIHPHALNHYFFLSLWQLCAVFTPSAMIDLYASFVYLFSTFACDQSWECKLSILDEILVGDI